MKRVFGLTVTFALLVACADQVPAGPEFHRTGGTEAVSVFNQNLYVGADVDLVIGALATPDPNDDLPALLAAIETLGATDFPARAGAIAERIARERPVVVGFQEVSTIDIVLPPLGIELHLDFLEVIEAALAARGLTYDVAASVTNVTATLPGVSLVDRDVMLVDPSRATVTGTIEQNFSANVGEIVPGVDLVRGFVAVTATVGGESIVFVNTHPEPDLGGDDLTLLRAAQITELLAVVGGAERVIMMGDFNDVPGSPMHALILDAGFTDVWAALRPGLPGFTCCHLADLSNPLPAFEKRIDYVFARGIEPAVSGAQGRIDLYGDVAADRLEGPEHTIWPSDHAGLFVRLLAPPTLGVASN